MCQLQGVCAWALVLSVACDTLRPIFIGPTAKATLRSQFGLMGDTEGVNTPRPTETSQPRLVVEVNRSRIVGSIEVPGSKSSTNRALVIAGLANGSSRISNGLSGDDAASMV